MAFHILMPMTANIIPFKIYIYNKKFLSCNYLYITTFSIKIQQIIYEWVVHMLDSRGLILCFPGELNFVSIITWNKKISYMLSIIFLLHHMQNENKVIYVKFTEN